MIKKNKGFTLIELLVVIAIIGILASIVLTSLTSAKSKAQRTAMLANMRGVMPELVVCADDAGYGYTAGAPTAGTTYICQESTSGNVAKISPAHTATWPTVPTGSGWTYGTPTGTLSANSYVFTANASSQTTITCSLSTGTCS